MSFAVLRYGGGARDAFATTPGPLPRANPRGSFHSLICQFDSSYRTSMVVTQWALRDGRQGTFGSSRSPSRSPRSRRASPFRRGDTVNSSRCNRNDVPFARCAMGILLRHLRDRQRPTRGGDRPRSGIFGVARARLRVEGDDRRTARRFLKEYRTLRPNDRHRTVQPKRSTIAITNTGSCACADAASTRGKHRRKRRISDDRTRMDGESR